MDKVTAAMVLTSLSTSPLVRSPPVRPNEGLSGSWKEAAGVPSSIGSSGYWSWSAPSDQSNPSTPSPPLSADSFKPFRSPAPPDDGIDEAEASNLLFDEPIPRKRKVGRVIDVSSYCDTQAESAPNFSFPLDSVPQSSPSERLAFV
ncbi:hypothetical protein MC885_000710 [Smutsia gigantea]|nr:hypothetical protein MC885_000710 [Smutsia gigantea]